MAVAGLNNVSVLESSYLGENSSPASRRWGNQERPITRTSYIRKMWRDLEGENRFTDLRRQQTSCLANNNIRSQYSCSSAGAESEDASITTSEVENECPRNQNQMDELQNGQHRSPALCLADKQRVRQIFREWGSKNYSRAQGVSEKESRRVRTVRQWIESNTRQAETGGSIQHQDQENGVSQTGFGARRSIRRLYGRQALLDLLKRFEMERKQEVQCLMENRLVSTFAHRNRIQSLLKGRFLWNQRFVQDNQKSTSVAANELGLFRQTQSVSDLRRGFLSKFNNHEHIHDGSQTQSDTSSDNGMKYHPENETKNLTSDVSQTHEVDYETDTCPSLQVEDNHEPEIQTGEQETSSEPEECQESVTEDNGSEWHHLDLEANSIELNEDEWYPESENGLEGTTTERWFPENGPEDSITERWSPENSPDDAPTERWSPENSPDDAPTERWFSENVPEDAPTERWSPEIPEETTTEIWFPEASESVVRTDVLLYASEDDENGRRLELRQLMSRRRVSNLLQSDFRLRLDHLLQSYITRQNQPSESDNEEEETDDISDHSSLPPVTQTQQQQDDWQIIDGLRVDMVNLQERMNSMQKTLETCMNMQLELQRSVQQEVSSALNRKENKSCFLCCDGGFDSSPDRCGHVYICSGCAQKVDWSKLRKSVKRQAPVS